MLSKVQIHYQKHSILYQRLLKLLLLGLFIYILQRQINLQKLKALLKEISLLSLLIALLLKIAAIIASASVLNSITKIYLPKSKLLRQLKIYFLSYYYNFFGLGSLGGDSYKFLQLQKLTTSRLRSSLILIIEKLIGLALLTSLALIAFYYYFHQLSLWLFLLSTPLLAALIFWLLVKLFSFSLQIKRIIPSTKFKSALAKLGKVNELIGSSNYQQLAVALLSSLAFYLCNIAALFTIMRGFGSEGSFALSALTIPLVLLVNTLPFSFQGLGLREITIVGIFTSVGLSSELGLLCSLGLLVVNLIIAALAALYNLTQS
jgi:uncharacterized membrane protein YbhN (UPF0104 family)